MLAKTAQKHDYPSAAWRRSYARRTGAERGFATVKDPAANDITRGWCRLMGLTPLMLFTTTLLVVRNQRILTAWDARQAENQRRAAAGLPPRTRRRRRKTLTVLAAPHGRPSRRARPHAANSTRHEHQAAPGHRTRPAAACPETAPGTQEPTRRTRTAHRHRQRLHPRSRNVRPKRENRPHRNVKTSGWS